MKEDMRGLFFIVKGQYRKGVSPCVINEVTGDEMSLGCYDPCDDHTSNWYMLLDNKTYHCVACGSDYDMVLNSVYKVIKRYKGVAEKYFKGVCSTTSEDYYEVHYLGHAPLTEDQITQKAIGRCPRVSLKMKWLYERVYEEYSDFFKEDVELKEDLAYTEIKENTPLNKARKLVSKNKTPNNGVEMTQKEHTFTTSETLVKVKPKRGLGVKKLQME